MRAALGAALQADLHIHIQQNSQVRLQTGSGVIDKGAHILQILTVSVALVSQGRIGITVTQHDAPLSQLGADDLLHDLGAGSLVEQGLGVRVHLLVLQVMDHSPDLLADGGSPWFARAQHLPALTFQPFG